MIKWTYASADDVRVASVSIGARTSIARIISDTMAIITNTCIGRVLVNFGFFTCIPCNRPLHHNWALCVVELRRGEIGGAEVEGFVFYHTNGTTRGFPPFSRGGVVQRIEIALVKLDSSRDIYLAAPSTRAWAVLGDFTVAWRLATDDELQVCTGTRTRYLINIT